MLVLTRLMMALVVMAGIALIPTITAAVSQPKLPSIESMTTAERTTAIASARQGVVRVSSTGCGVGTIGSGFVADGLVVTNAHVAGDAPTVAVDRFGPSGGSARFELAVTGRSGSADLAVAEVRWGSPLSLTPAIPVVGEPVLLVGFAGGQRLAVIEATVHAVVDGTAYGSSGEVILFDRETGVGFSGGPVVDRHGQVVAVLRAFDSVTGLSVAVPAANVVELAERAANDAEEYACK